MYVMEDSEPGNMQKTLKDFMQICLKKLWTAGQNANFLNWSYKVLESYLLAAIMLYWLHLRVIVSNLFNCQEWFCLSDNFTVLEKTRLEIAEVLSTSVSI